MRNWLANLATCFGIGRLRPAPGTWGTLVAMPLAFGVSYFGPFVYMGACIFLVIIAILASEAHEQVSTSHDSSDVVIDEVVGFFITITWLPVTWQTFVVGFLLFRVFDIWKPLFIGVLDKKVKGGAGTVMDDVAAGMVANLILQVVYYKTDWLGWRWGGGW